MSNSQNPYLNWGLTAANASVDERVGFIRRTYAHLLAAVVAFAAIETILLNLPQTPALVQAMAGNQISWLVVVGAFVGVSYLANNWARSNQSQGMQYLGLSIYVVAEAIIFLPLLYIAHFVAPKWGAHDVIPIAGLLTLVTFGGLTATVMLTRADFSFLRNVLMLGGIAALGVVFCSILFGFNLGIIFVAALLALAAGYILYDTSNVLHHYRVDQHVAASLALFASVALMFYYMVNLVMRLQSRD